MNKFVSAPLNLLDGYILHLKHDPGSENFPPPARNYNLVHYASGMWLMRRGFDDFTGHLTRPYAGQASCDIRSAVPSRYSMR